MARISDNSSLAGRVGLEISLPTRRGCVRRSPQQTHTDWAGDIAVWMHENDARRELAASGLRNRVIEGENRLIG